MRNLKSQFAVIALGAAMVFSTTTAATAAPPGPEIQTGPNIQTTEVSSASCTQQVLDIAAETGIGAEEAAAEVEFICTGTVTAEISAPEVVTVAEARQQADVLNLDADETQELVAAAAAQQVNAHNWTQTYWGGSIVEKHAGRTFFNGSHAWVASAGDAGYHVCHSEGSWAVGFAITSYDCTKPTAGSPVDAFYRFDVGAAVQGSPVSFGVGLHFVVDRLGGYTSYQVGG